jgi:hypothetical protein
MQDTLRSLVTFPEAGAPLPGLPTTQPCDGPNLDPLFPFESKLQWDVCHTHMEENMAKSSLNRIIRRGLFKDGFNVKNANHLRELTHAMNDGICCEWEKGTIDIECVDIEYWYRDPIAILRYLFGYLPFKEHLTPAAIKGNDFEGKRLYCEMQTGNWWWWQHVNTLSTSAP